METKKAIVILVLIASLSVSITSAIHSYLTVADSKEIKMHLTVGEYAGFTAETSGLIFGTTVKGGGASREVTLGNNFTIPLQVEISSTGKLSKWVYVSENDFLLEPNASKAVKVSIAVPVNAELGNYTGVLKINFIKP